MTTGAWRGSRGGWLLAFIALGAVTGSSCSYNKFTARKKPSRAMEPVENELQRRNDLIPNLVATVKGYATGADRFQGRRRRARQTRRRADDGG